MDDFVVNLIDNGLYNKLKTIIHMYYFIVDKYVQAVAKFKFLYLSTRFIIIKCIDKPHRAMLTCRYCHVVAIKLYTKMLNNANILSLSLLVFFIFLKIEHIF